jgi:hypothetical protein
MINSLCYNDLQTTIIGNTNNLIYCQYNSLHHKEVFFFNRKKSLTLGINTRVTIFISLIIITTDN